MHGERLYYIVLSFKFDAFNSAVFLINKLEELSLIDSSCAHLIFGDMDVIIRLWADDKKINELKLIINDFKMVSSYKFILIENHFTWYKEKINRKILKYEFDEKLLDRILKGDIDHNFYILLKNDQKSICNYKYWIFVEEPYSSNSNFYSKIKDILNRNKKHKLLEGTYNISIYSYITNTRRGFLIKCSTDNFVMSCDKISKLIADNSADNEFKLTTYIARKEIKEDSDQINFGKATQIPIESRKMEILYNLLKSHDCYRGMFLDDSEEANLINSFCVNLVPLFYDIFRFHSTWCEKIRHARNSLKWVVEKKNSTLVSVLLREYVVLETKLRKILDVIYQQESSSIKGLIGFGKKLNNKYKLDEIVINEIISMIENKFVPSKLTLGDIPHILSLLVSKCPGDQKNCLIINEFSNIVSQIASDRNSLAHGEEAFLFQHDRNNKKWLWEQYAFNFMKYHFYNPKWAPILREKSDLFIAEQRH